jgi:hypothetical protein
MNACVFLSSNNIPDFLFLVTILLTHVLWVPVTTAWRVLRFRMKERSPIWKAAANTLNKQSRTADDGWSSSLGVGRGANNSSPWKTKCYVIFTCENLLVSTVMNFRVP